MLINIRKSLGAVFSLIGKAATATQSAVAAYFFIKGKIDTDEPEREQVRRKRKPGRPSKDSYLKQAKPVKRKPRPLQDNTNAITVEPIEPKSEWIRKQGSDFV